MIVALYCTPLAVGRATASRRPAVPKELRPIMIAQRYPEHFIAPMREELTVLGFEELHTPVEVDQAVSRPGTTLLVVNSVCGCAAGKARPGIALALRHLITPGHLA